MGIFCRVLHTRPHALGASPGWLRLGTCRCGQRSRFRTKQAIRQGGLTRRRSAHVPNDPGMTTTDCELCSLHDKATMMRPSSYRYGAANLFRFLQDAVRFSMDGGAARG